MFARHSQTARREENTMSNIGVNKVILIGNAGQNAEVKSTSSGKSVANFSLAINEGFRDKGGEIRAEGRMGSLRRLEQAGGNRRQLH